MFTNFLLSSFCVAFCASSLFGQLTGTKTIPGDYNSIAAAIADLNTSGVGSGGVIFNISAEHTETFPSAGAGLITASGSEGNSITFQKSGTGTNPVITAGTGSSQWSDGIIVIAGGDYITFDAIDLIENSSNTNNITRMEWGYALVKANTGPPYNGCQYVTIKNSAITLSGNYNTRGIYSANHTTENNDMLILTDTLGAMNCCKFYNNNISRVGIGMWILGWQSINAPNEFYDRHNEIGVDGGNTITLFGIGTQGYGIAASYQNYIKVANNTINGGDLVTGQITGINVNIGNSSADIYGNMITLNPVPNTSYIYALSVFKVIGGQSDTVNIYNNIIENCTGCIGNSYFYGIKNYPNSKYTNVYGNIIRNNTMTAAATAPAQLLQIAPGGISNVYNNEIYGNTHLGTGKMYCIVGTQSGLKNVFGNSVYNNSSGGGLYGLYIGNDTSNVYKNNFYNLTTSDTISPVYPFYQTAGTAYFYNNFLSDINAPSSTGFNAISGFYINSGTSGLYYNTIFLNAVSSSLSTFGTSGIYAETAAKLEMKNNVIINNSTPGPAGGYTVAYRRSSDTLNTYALTSDNNDFYAGEPGPARLIFSDGIHNDQTIQEFKNRVAPRDISSFSEDPPFLNAVNPPYNLRISTLVQTALESGGSPVTEPVEINDDYDNELRNNIKPDVGADEFNGIPTNVELVSFTVEVADRSVVLKWQTASEINNKGFSVERKPVEGEYTEISFITGNGTTTEPCFYQFTDTELLSGLYYYRLKQLDFDGTIEYSSEIKISMIRPEKYSLGQNYPNPFNPSTKIDFGLKENCNVNISVFDIKGAKVKNILNEKMQPGYHTVKFESNLLPSGVYFYRIEAGSFTATRKMLILK